jgi:hypothetical protein
MDLSLVLARFWGLVLVALCAPLLNKRTFTNLVEKINNEQVVFLYSLIAIFMGALSVAILNTWSLNYKGLITLFGWAALIKGLFGIVLPRRSMELVNRSSQQWPLVFLLLVLYVLLGVWLLYVGFVRLLNY